MLQAALCTQHGKDSNLWTVQWMCSCTAGLCLTSLGYTHAMCTQPSRPQVEDTVQHVVQVEPSSWEQGLDERRLVLTLDTEGMVLATSNAPSSLFGFRCGPLLMRQYDCWPPLATARASGTASHPHCDPRM